MMPSIRSTVCSFLLAPQVLVAALADGSHAQPIQRGREQLKEPVLYVADAARQAPIHQNHPLMPLLQVCNDSLAHCQRNIRDYSTLLVKREKVKGVLMDHQFISTKIRHERTDVNGRVTTPFSVYMKFEGPQDLKGREVIWIKGQNKDKLIAHEGDGLIGFFSIWLDPQGKKAMADQRYPISQIGIENLLIQLVERSKRNMRAGQPDDFQVRLIKEGVSVDGRPCTLLEIQHPVRRAYLDTHVARMFIDNQYKIPIRYAAWDWPERPGEPPALIEEYTYQNLKLNLGFDDAHFSHRNKEYNF